MSIRIGIFSPQEVYSYSLIEAINEKGRKKGITAEFINLPPVSIEETCPYRVIIDCLSHRVKFIRTYLKHVFLNGVKVINNPFLFSYDDKFHGFTAAFNLGISVPRTVVLPSRTYDEHMLSFDLHNLAYPVEWNKIVEYTGFPAILKPVDGYGWKNVYKVNNTEELLHYYNLSGEDVMMLQEFIPSEDYFRCFVFGKKYVLPVRYDPHNRTYMVTKKPCNLLLQEKIIKDCIALNQKLGYDMNTVEFAVRNGIPYAIDFTNPVPDTRPEIIQEEHYNTVVDKLAIVAIEYGLEIKQ